MSSALALLALSGLASPALAQDGDPWSPAAAQPSADDPWSAAPPASPPVASAPLPADPDDPWAAPPPAPPPVVLPPPPPPVEMPVVTAPAPAGLGFPSLDACRDAWQRDRSWFQQLAPTWAHPSTERCVWAAGADRWTIDEEPAGMVLSAAVDLPLLVGAGALALGGAGIDVLEHARDNWDLSSDSQRAVAGAGAQRRDALPTRTDPDVGAGRVADWIFAGSLVGAGLSPLALPTRNGRLTNAVVMGEILALQYGTWSVVSGSVAELRPLGFQQMQTWADDDFAAAAGVLTEPAAWRSYYSGKTSTVAAVSYGTATILSIDALDAGRPSAGLTLLLLPVAFMVSNLEGQLQLDALQHDGTDVWVGHLAGGAIGVGVPVLHHLAAQHGRARSGAAPAGPAMVRPLVGPGTLGLSGRW